MSKYILKRIFKGLVTIFITVTLTFLIVRLMPSNPIYMLIDTRMSEAQIQAMTEKFGLDKPLWEQYVLYLRNLLQGDLGTSFAQKRPVLDIIGEKLPWTLLLMGLAQVLTMLIGIPLGIYSGYKRGTIFDHIINAISVFGISIFVPWLGFTLLYFFGYQLAILPVGGAITPGISGFWRILVQQIKHNVSPPL